MKKLLFIALIMLSGCSTAEHKDLKNCENFHVPGSGLFVRCPVATGWVVGGEGYNSGYFVLDEKHSWKLAGE